MLRPSKVIIGTSLAFELNLSLAVLGLATRRTGSGDGRLPSRCSWTAGDKFKVLTASRMTERAMCARDPPALA